MRSVFPGTSGGNPNGDHYGHPVLYVSMKELKWLPSTRSPCCHNNRGFLLGFTGANLYIAHRPKAVCTKKCVASSWLFKTSCTVLRHRSHGMCVRGAGVVLGGQASRVEEGTGVGLHLA